MSTIYRNWPAIATISHTGLRAVLSAIDLATEEGGELQKAFPQCFSTTRIEPTPYSVLEQYAEASNKGQFQDPIWNLVTLGAVQYYGLPHIAVYLTSEAYEKRGEVDHTSFFADVNEYDALSDMGVMEKVTFRGDDYVVVEGGDRHVIHLVPVAAVDTKK